MRGVGEWESAVGTEKEAPWAERARAAAAGEGTGAARQFKFKIILPVESAVLYINILLAKIIITRIVILIRNLYSVIECCSHQSAASPFQQPPGTISGDIPSLTGFFPLFCLSITQITV